MLSRQNLPIEGNTDNLILVLMEDTHRVYKSLLFEYMEVLILVLMEDTHRVTNFINNKKVRHVLILVLMEDTHRVVCGFVGKHDVTS